MFSQYLSEKETICLVAFVVIFGFLGLVLNLFLILSISFSDEFSDSPANLFVLSLAVADALLGCAFVPLSIYSTYFPALDVFFTASNFLILATTGSIFLLTLNRFVSTVRPLRYPTIVTYRRATAMVPVIWLAALFVLVLAVVSLIFNAIANLKITRYIVAFYIVSFFVLCVYMYHLGRKHAKRMAKQAFAVAGQLQAASHEFRALRSLFLIAGSFGVCWLPATIQTIILDSEENPELFYRAFCFTAPLIFLNTIWDPDVYYFRSKGFRLSLRRLKRQILNFRYCDCC